MTEKEISSDTTDPDTSGSDTASTSRKAGSIKELLYDEDIPSAETISIEEDDSKVPTDALMVSPAGKAKRQRTAGVLFALLVVILLLGAHLGGVFDEDDDEEQEIPDDPGEGFRVVYLEPVMLPRELVELGQATQDHPEGAIGYEPSLAVDSTGAMSYTAHKDLRWQESWDYTASWWYISTDDGVSWRDPSDIMWNGISDTVGMKDVWAGDEGDIAIDAQDRIYYIDTYLEDNNLHVFQNRGDDWVFSKRHQSTAFDDRPWITAQGNGILHYLGNNGVSIGSGRYWYYRSTNGGITFSLGTSIVSGWASINAERFGDHVYIAHEGSDAANNPDVFMYSSSDQGVCWNWNDRVYVGPMERNGIGEGWPTVFHGSNGVVYVIWQDSPDSANSPGILYLARSEDYGQSFECWDISMPEGAAYLYPTVNVCQYGEFHERNRLGISFYGTTDLPAGPESEWYLYAAVAENPTNGTQLDFQIADPEPLYTGDDLHALHDFYEIVIAPDGSLNIAYQRNIGSHPYEAGEEQRYLMFVRGEVLE